MEIIMLIYAGCTIPGQLSTRHLEPWEGTITTGLLRGLYLYIPPSLDFQALSFLLTIAGSRLKSAAAACAHLCYSAGLSRADPHFLKWKHTQKKAWVQFES